LRKYILVETIIDGQERGKNREPVQESQVTRKNENDLYGMWSGRIENKGKLNKERLET
jgi:hypothetical protein